MERQRYYPRTEGNQIQWFNNLLSKIANYYAALGITLADQAKLTLVLNWLIWTWATFIPARRHEGPAATMYREKLATGEPGGDATPPDPASLTPPAGPPFTGMLSWLFDQIEGWKKADGYTETIGLDLGLLGPQKSAPDPNATPEVKATVRGGEVILTFKKEGHMGIWIEGEVGSDTSFTFLAIDTTSPYNDTRPLRVPGVPEKRRYRVCFWDNDPTNVWCDVIEVTFGG